MPSNNKALTAFEMLYMDLWEPFRTPSIHGHRFFLTIIDDYSRFCWTIMIKSKTEVSIHVQNLLPLQKNNLQPRLKLLELIIELSSP